MPNRATPANSAPTTSPVRAGEPVVVSTNHGSATAAISLPSVDTRSASSNAISGRRPPVPSTVGATPRSPTTLMPRPRSPRCRLAKGLFVTAGAPGGWSLPAGPRRSSASAAGSGEVETSAAATVQDGPADEQPRLRPLRQRLLLAVAAPLEYDDAGVVLQLVGLMGQDAAQQPGGGFGGRLANSDGGLDEVGQPVLAEEPPVG